MTPESETKPVVETPVVPEGAVLSLDSTTTEPVQKEEKEPTPGAFMTPEKFMGIMKKMVDTEQLTKEQARQMRRQFGITQSYFTGKKVSTEQKKAKRQIANTSRVKNRYNGSSKGQKRSSGRGD